MALRIASEKVHLLKLDVSDEWATHIGTFKALLVLRKSSKMAVVAHAFNKRLFRLILNVDLIKP